MAGHIYPTGRFNPPSPCGEGQHVFVCGGTGSGFQSTLPVWGGTEPAPITSSMKTFQSTLPVWGGTWVWLGRYTLLGVSIHPPRVGRDRPCPFDSTHYISFNPPSPCGEGHRPCGAFWRLSGFNPPSPCGEGQQTGQFLIQATGVSIHPPRVGRDSKSSQKFFVNFCARRQYYQNF